MAITTTDGLIAALTTAQRIPIYFPSVTTVAGRLTNLNSAGAGYFGQMATPTAAGSGGQLYTDATTGFAPFTNPTGGNKTYLAVMSPAPATVGTMLLYDLVWACSGFSGTVTTAQSVTGFPSLTRPDANGTGLELFAQVFTAIGATGTTFTVSYTNQASVAGRTTIAQNIGATGLNEVHRVIPVFPQAGDSGYRSIQSVTLAATTGTAGNWGLLLARRIAEIPMTLANAQPPLDFAALGLPEIQDDTAFLSILQASATTSGIITGGYRLVQG
jgi:hypothetical protein